MAIVDQLHYAAYNGSLDAARTILKSHRAHIRNIFLCTCAESCFLQQSMSMLPAAICSRNLFAGCAESERTKRRDKDAARLDEIESELQVPRREYLTAMMGSDGS